MLLKLLKELFENRPTDGEHVEEINSKEEVLSLPEPIRINERLYEHFSMLTMHDGQLPLYLYHGGAHKPGKPVKGTLWLSDNHLDAKRYANFGCSNIPNHEPIVFKTEPSTTLKMLSFPGNHVEILFKIYGRAWSHSEFHKDLVQIQNAGKIDFDGFYRPKTHEYFVLNVEDSLHFLEEHRIKY
ncbi:hypothetical protein H5187_19980 [Pseudoalteromonas sp. SG44-1]|uniref:hypothetical protein n=1 Tax=Pseudoalteromonas sp. SG44-1 TaxID=2760964 RepID=UPI001603676F|nr:hypothetical protein [Pseudoalteromonas sp. SG44-1]MBB1419533.1 hypothetical protein [Pseudoalteromonas sp. SG44-1]